VFPKSRCSGYQARSRVVDSPTAGWCARRSPGAGSLTPPADGTEIKSTGSCRCGVSVAGASLDCQADLGAVGLNTEDPVFSCPSSQPPPSEAPLAAHLSPNPPTPSPKKPSYTYGGDAIFSIKRLPLFATEPRFKKMNPRRGPTTTRI